MITVKGSYKHCSFDNIFWNVDILLNHPHKLHRLVKRTISPSQHFPIKLSGSTVPKSAPGGLESAESKVSQYAFPRQRKEKQTGWSISGTGERRAARGEAVADERLTGWHFVYCHWAFCAGKTEKKNFSPHKPQLAALLEHWLGFTLHQMCQKNKQEKTKGLLLNSL